jgi:hypothetical protein
MVDKTQKNGLHQMVDIATMDTNSNPRQTSAASMDTTSNDTCPYVDKCFDGKKIRNARTILIRWTKKKN